MSEESVFDAFKLCWKIIIQESAKYGNNFFSAKDCKLLDSRDTNFEIIENRLAYTYKYGYFNTLFFEKCLVLFINQCSDALFPFENLNVCSLSNGPGFDVLGFLSALCFLNKPLKGLPVFTAVNIYGSWSELYKTLVWRAYEKCITKSSVENFNLNHTNYINMIQGDIYSIINTEAKNCISNSNVLLMVNAFVSSKATPTIFENSLKEIFTLLKPGSLIFFIGSKNSIILFSKLTHLKQYVKCVYGPQKVTLNDLPVDEEISNVIGTKPQNSGHATFIVWRKKHQASKLAVELEESLKEDIVVDDDSDTTSELYPSSESSIFSFVENQNKSSPEGIKSENMLHCESQNKPSSVENITSLLTNIKLNSVSSDKKDDSIMETKKKINLIFSEKDTSVISNNQIVEDTMKEDKECSAVAMHSASNVSPITERKNGSIMNQNTPSKKSKKKKVKSLSNTEVQSLNGSTEKNNCEHPRPLERNSLQDNSCKNTVEMKEKILHPQVTNDHNSNFTTNNNVQLLLQKCEGLISKLEELAVNVKKESAKQKTCFCNQQVKNCKPHHYGCYVRIVQSCCCGKLCKH